MLKALASMAALGVAVLVATPGPADARDRRADGVSNVTVTDISAQRRRYRRVHRYSRRYYRPRRIYRSGYFWPGMYRGHYHVRRHYRPRYYYPSAYGYYPSYYGAYAYYPRYYRPGPYISIGPGGFSFGLGF